MIICIESNHEDQLKTILGLLKSEFQQRHMNVRFLSFPSDGPFGHQIRVVESGRFTFQTIPDHLLRMVDRMDAFFNPANGLNQSLPILDCLIMTESQYKEAAQTKEEIQDWVIEINSNLPFVKTVYWLTEGNEQLPLFLDSPPIKYVLFEQKNLYEAAKNLLKLITAEVKHD